MLGTLLEILSWYHDFGSPEIMLEDDGDICLDWFEPRISVSINRNGGLSWSILKPNMHGNRIEDLKKFFEDQNKS